MRPPLSAELLSKLAEYQLEGLIPEDFTPHGDTEHERYGSIEALAYTAWIEKNRLLCANHHPETVRSAFQLRHDPYWTMPALDIPDIDFGPPKPVPGFATAGSALPRGDSWEGNEQEPAEDVPPPAEVS